jgi:DNA-binding HxlR family transcriptional regulator
MDKTYTKRRDLPEKLEQLLASVKDYKGEYEYESDYMKVYDELQGTNPFSVLVFYELSKKKTSFAKIKKLNPNIPERLLASSLVYEQFYFIPETEERRVGGYPGSGYRQTQSVYALSLALMSKDIDVPTHLLIYDQNNKMQHVLSSRELIVQPHEVLQTVDLETSNEILKDTIKAYGSRSEDFQLVKNIFVKK